MSEQSGNIKCLCDLSTAGFVTPTECSAGFYGASCQRRCECPAGVPCDHVTGDCQPQCPMGLGGVHCDQGELGEVPPVGACPPDVSTVGMGQTYWLISVHYNDICPLQLYLLHM